MLSPHEASAGSHSTPLSSPHKTNGSANRARRRGQARDRGGDGPGVGVGVVRAADVRLGVGGLRALLGAVAECRCPCSRPARRRTRSPRRRPSSSSDPTRSRTSSRRNGEASSGRRLLPSRPRRRRPQRRSPLRRTHPRCGACRRRYRGSPRSPRGLGDRDEEEASGTHSFHDISTSALRPPQYRLRGRGWARSPGRCSCGVHCVACVRGSATHCAEIASLLNVRFRPSSTTAICPRLPRRQRFSRRTSIRQKSGSR